MPPSASVCMRIDASEWSNEVRVSKGSGGQRVHVSLDGGITLREPLLVAVEGTRFGPGHTDALGGRAAVASPMVPRFLEGRLVAHST